MRVAETVPSKAKGPRGPPERQKKQMSLPDVGQVRPSEREHGGGAKRSHKSQGTQIAKKEARDQVILKHRAKDSQQIGAKEIPERGAKEGDVRVALKECLLKDDHRHGLPAIPEVVQVECVPKDPKYGDSEVDQERAKGDGPEDDLRNASWRVVCPGAWPEECALEDPQHDGAEDIGAGRWWQSGYVTRFLF